MGTRRGLDAATGRGAGLEGALRHAARRKPLSGVLARIALLGLGSTAPLRRLQRWWDLEEC